MYAVLWRTRALAAASSSMWNPVLATLGLNPEPAKSSSPRRVRTKPAWGHRLLLDRSFVADMAMLAEHFVMHDMEPGFWDFNARAPGAAVGG